VTGSLPPNLREIITSPQKPHQRRGDGWKKTRTPTRPNPPYHTSAFILTHHANPPLAMKAIRPSIS